MIGKAAAVGLGLTLGGAWLGDKSAEMARDKVQECAEVLGQSEVVRPKTPIECKGFSFDTRQVAINGVIVETEYTLPSADLFKREELSDISVVPRQIILAIGTTVFVGSCGLAFYAKQEEVQRRSL